MKTTKLINNYYFYLVISRIFEKAGQIFKVGGIIISRRIRLKINRHLEILDRVNHRLEETGQKWVIRLYDY